jgi:hypothetical protein
MQLRTEVEIEAPAREVWRVLADFRAYPQWNPFITQISGQLMAGQRLAVTLGSSEGRQWNVSPTLLVVEPERELRWVGHLWIKGLFDGEHFFSLREVDGKTRLTHGEDFRGILVKFMRGTLTDAARGFVGMNQALKRRVEQRAERAAS